MTTPRDAVVASGLILTTVAVWVALGFFLRHIWRDLNGQLNTPTKPPTGGFSS